VLKYDTDAAKHAMLHRNSYVSLFPTKNVQIILVDVCIDKKMTLQL